MKTGCSLSRIGLVVVNLIALRRQMKNLCCPEEKYGKFSLFPMLKICHMIVMRILPLEDHLVIEISTRFPYLLIFTHHTRTWINVYLFTLTVSQLEHQSDKYIMQR